MLFFRRSLVTKYIAWLAMPACFINWACNDHERTWAAYKADPASSSYSPLGQVNKENVQQLKLAWTFNPNDAGEGSHFGASQCNPIIVDGVMYAASARHRIYAVNAATGKTIWSFDPFNGGPGGGSFRGVTWWSDGNDKRILFTGGDKLYALDASTGKPISSFGHNGSVSIEGLWQLKEYTSLEDQLILESLDVRLLLKDVYDRCKL